MSFESPTFNPPQEKVVLSTEISQSEQPPNPDSASQEALKNPQIEFAAAMSKLKEFNKMAYDQMEAGFENLYANGGSAAFADWAIRYRNNNMLEDIQNIQMKIAEGDTSPILARNLEYWNEYLTLWERATAINTTRMKMMENGQLAVH